MEHSRSLELHQQCTRILEEEPEFLKKRLYTTTANIVNPEICMMEGLRLDLIFLELSQ